MSAPIQQLAITLGEIPVNCTVKRSKKRRRTLAMVLDPKEGIVVHIPWRTSETALQEFILSHQRWILARVQQLNTLPLYTLASGDTLQYLGASYPLRVIEGVKRAHCTHQQGEFQVGIKQLETAEHRRKAVYLQLKKWYYTQAYAFLSERLVFWQKQLNITYNGLRISNPKRQWGCCHANNSISINWRIMMTSLELIDYLLVHELCHVPHKNHSPRFWRLVGSVIPDYQQKRRALQNHAASFFGAEF